MLNIDNKLSSLPIWRYASINHSVTSHLCKSNEQQLILTKFYTNNGFCEVTPNHFSFRFLWIKLDTKT